MALCGTLSHHYLLLLYGYACWYGWLEPACTLVGAQDHIVSCYAARMTGAVQCSIFGGITPAAPATCCLAGLWCTGSLTLAHEYTPCLRDRRLGLLRCPRQTLRDMLHVLRSRVQRDHVVLHTDGPSGQRLH